MTKLSLNEPVTAPATLNTPVHDPVHEPVNEPELTAEAHPSLAAEGMPSRFYCFVTGTDTEIGKTLVRTAMDDHPLTCTSETELDEVRRMMLDRHARYMPVMNQRVMMGVISFYDVAKTVVDSQNFENKMLKAYIRDWPTDGKGDALDD